MVGQEMETPKAEKQTHSATSSPTSWRRSLSVRKDPKTANLRDRYKDSASDALDLPDESSKPGGLALPNPPYLPPTPPTVEQIGIQPAVEELPSDASHLRTSLVTPTNHNSPPTPDNTPPRIRNRLQTPPYLGAKPSIASTRADSFKTAREEFTSDDEYDLYPRYRAQQSRRARPFYTQAYSADSQSQTRFFSQSSLNEREPYDSQSSIRKYRPVEPVREGSGSETDSTSVGHVPPQKTSTTSSIDTPMLKEEIPSPKQTIQISDRPLTEAESMLISSVYKRLTRDALEKREPEEPSVPELRRGLSLRDRVMAAQNISNSPSVEKFASIIGWSNSVSEENFRPEAKRNSGVSVTSAVEAIVIPSPSIPRRATTLRHVPKHGSLRSVSSPLPASNRNSTYSNPESPHRLIHKNAKISNQNRWSFGSEISRTGSLASSAALPRGEIITVAIIPERRSSLSSSNGSSRRHSLSAISPPSKTRKPSENPPSSWQPRRNFSESATRGRKTEAPYLIPPRSSSLSAPTSRDTSRANSLTSEHIRTQQQAAETDLRQTLDRMESERLVASLQSLPQSESEDEQEQARQPPSTPEQKPQPISDWVPATFPETPRKFSSHRQRHSTDSSFYAAVTNGVEPGTLEWAALRPQSVLDTPFSQPSYLSTSPEIKEARAINFVSHNPNSLQLIEPFPLEESRAVSYVRKQPNPDVLDSPLRHPRSPPLPPKVQVIPPTPGNDHEHQIRHMTGRLPNRRYQSLYRTSPQRSDSLVKSLARNFSLRNPKNKKAEQDLDGNLHPFWRPRPFWDDADPPRYQNVVDADRNGNSNSQQYKDKSTSKGPMALIRRISSRRQDPRKIVKQGSQSSLSRLRAGRKLHRSSGLGGHMSFMGIRELPDWLLQARQRKETEKWQKRQMELRQKIGNNVVHQSDSRFPASDTDLAQQD